MPWNVEVLRRRRTVHPYFEAIIQSYAQSGRPYFHQGTPEEARAMMAASLLQARTPTGLPDLASIFDEVIFGPSGTIPIRRYVPKEKPLGKVIYLHSGGWVLGTLDHADAVCRRLAAHSQCELISVDYRLAPEHPYPAPLEDAWTVLCETAKDSQGPVLLVGESAGGNLAAACSIRARDQAGPAIAGTVLAYPVTNCDFETSHTGISDHGIGSYLLQICAGIGIITARRALIDPIRLSLH